MVEEFDEHDFSVWSGLFSASCQGSSCKPMLLGPQRVRVDEAIAWARDHAGIVWVRAADSRHYFSAGKQVPPGDAMRVLAAGRMSFSRRRDPAMRYLDRTPADPSIRWAVTLPPGLAGAPPGFAERFYAHVIMTTTAADRGNGGCGRGVVRTRRRDPSRGGARRSGAIARDAMRAARLPDAAITPAFGWTMSVKSGRQPTRRLTSLGRLLPTVSAPRTRLCRRGSAGDTAIIPGVTRREGYRR